MAFVSSFQDHKVDRFGKPMFQENMKAGVRILNGLDIEIKNGISTSQANRRAIRQAVKKGMSKAEVARICGCSAKTVERFCKENG